MRRNSCIFEIRPWEASEKSNECVRRVAIVELFGSAAGLGCLDALLGVVAADGAGVEEGCNGGLGGGLDFGVEYRAAWVDAGFCFAALPHLSSASCAFWWDHLPSDVLKQQRKDNISGSGCILYKCFLVCPGRRGKVLQWVMSRTLVNPTRTCE